MDGLEGIEKRTGWRYLCAIEAASDVNPITRLEERSGKLVATLEDGMKVICPTPKDGSEE